MRFVVMVKLTDVADYEAGRMPTEGEITEMMTFNEALAEAGIMLSGEGLHPTAKGARVAFTGGQPVVTDGPFTESTEVLGGYWIWQVASKEEALDWAKRCPMQAGDVLELRQIFDMEAFGIDPQSELGQQVERVDAAVAAQRAAAAVS